MVLGRAPKREAARSCGVFLVDGGWWGRRMSAPSLNVDTRHMRRLSRRRDGLLQDEYHLYGRYTASNNKNASICYPEYPVDIVGYDAVVSSQNTPPIMPPLNDACTPPASIERSKELSAK